MGRVLSSYKALSEVRIPKTHAFLEGDTGCRLFRATQSSVLAGVKLLEAHPEVSQTFSGRRGVMSKQGPTGIHL
jgi:ureidoglycolate hydrolase